MEVDSQCPKCEEVASYTVNLASLLTGLKGADFTKELSVGELSIQFKPISFKEINEVSTEQFQLQSLFAQDEKDEDEDSRARILQEGLKRITDLTMDLLSKSIVGIKMPNGIVTESAFILDFMKNCDRNIYTTIRDYSAKIRQDSEIKPMKITCGGCENEYEQSITLNPTDFFD
jgi:bacterioferritin-associated ferredoxin